jgi:hypothetical protein
MGLLGWSLAIAQNVAVELAKRIARVTHVVCDELSMLTIVIRATKRDRTWHSRDTCGCWDVS